MDGVLFFEVFYLEKGNFYFIDDQYFIDFPDPYLERNKEMVDGSFHDRPYYYAVKDTKNNLYWMVPISSKVKKYRKVYNEKIKKYGNCDTLVFGEILGFEKVFLLQNMCPVSEKYARDVYLQHGIPVKLDERLADELYEKASKIIQLMRKGKKVIFPDVLAIEKKLLNENVTSL